MRSSPRSRWARAERLCWLCLSLGLAASGAHALTACSPAPHGTIGAILGQQGDGRVFVREVPEDLGASKAGLEPGDELLFVDGVQASSLSPEELSHLLGGPVGAPVKLTLLRDEEVVRVTVTRTEARRYSSLGPHHLGSEKPESAEPGPDATSPAPPE